MPGCAQDTPLSTVSHNGSGKTLNIVEYLLFSTDSPHYKRGRSGRLFYRAPGLPRRVNISFL
ncbi:MAG: hypothetical protein ACI9W4_001906 [Rhodothermales bacterium]|jgi:hypothetical protein